MKISSPTCCPACGSKLSHNHIVVDLDRNQIARGDASAQLTPQQASITSLLADVSPAVVRLERLIERLYGAREAPDDAARAMRVQICHVRRKLAPLGLTVESAGRSGGWALRTC